MSDGATRRNWSKSMNVRVVVADEREADFFDLAGVTTPLEPRGVLTNEFAGLEDRDLETDKPGRGFNRGAPGRHAMDGERSTKQHEIEQFAREVARTLDEARVRREFERLVIVAGPKMLGLIRESLPPPCRSVVAAEVVKDLVHQESEAIREAVPRQAFLS
jgi:protein required for attachment to host cells